MSAAILNSSSFTSSLASEASNLGRFRLKSPELEPMWSSALVSSTDTDRLSLQPADLWKEIFKILIYSMRVTGWTVLH